MRKSLMTFIVFLILSALAFWGFIKWPRTFIPEEDQGYFIAFMQLTDGASSSQTATALQKASAVLNQMEGIETYITINGFSMMSNANASNAATLFVMLKNWDQRKSPQLSAQSLVNQFNGMAYKAIPEARTFAVLPPAIPGLGESSGFEVMLEDINNYGPQELQRMTDELMLAGNETPGLSTVQSMFSASVPQYYLNIDRNKVELMQIPLSEVFNTIGTYLGSTYVNNFVKFGRTYQVKVEGAPDSRALVTDLRLLNVRNSKGDMIPLSAFTTIETRIGAESLTKYNTYVSALISGAAADGYSSGEALNIMAKLIREKVGRSFGYEWTSMAYQEENASSSTSIIFILAIVVAFLILAAQYESWTDPGFAYRPAGSSDRSDGHESSDQRLHPNRSSASDCPGGEKCYPDRRIRPGLPGCRQVDRRIGDRRRTRTSPPDPDDLFCFHPRHFPAGDFDRSRSFEPDLDRYRRFCRYVDDLPRRHLVYSQFLPDDGELARTVYPQKEKRQRHGREPSRRIRGTTPDEAGVRQGEGLASLRS